MAVGDFITIDNSTTTATFANELISFVRLMRRVIEEAEKHKGIMDHLTTLQIETKYGVTGNGATVQTLIQGCRSAVRSATTLETIDRLG